MIMLKRKFHSKGVFANDVIILGGRGLRKDDARWRGKGGVELKMKSLFYMISGENFEQIDFKSWFYYK